MIKIFDRLLKQEETELVYKQNLLVFLYKKNWISKGFLFLFSRFSFFSFLFGLLQRTRSSASKIKPFVQKFHLNPSEWEKKIEDFSSFEDFFVRKLRKSSRSVVPFPNVAVLPADARYFVFPHLEERKDFCIKGCAFSLEEFLQDENLSKKYQDGSMVIARLCPCDYHRFHFAFDCVPQKPTLINGYLYSVHPIALKENSKIFSQNKRVITRLHSKIFQEVLWIEVGATNVGSIHQTFIPNQEYKKGDEKGYFSFGGSTLVLLFLKDTIRFDNDLIEMSRKGIEVRGLFGQSLGVSTVDVYK